MERTSRETWAKRIERWKESGLTAKEFAAEVGLSASSLQWWKWRLGAGATWQPAKRGRTRSSTGRPAALTKPRSISPVTFVEMSAPIVSDALEVILPSTVRVCVRPGFDDTTLGRLLDVLERRR